MTPCRRLAASIVAIVVEISLVRAQSCGDWNAPEPVEGFDGEIRALRSWDPDGAGPRPAELLVGGRFGAVGGTMCRGLALWNGERWTDVGGSTDGAVSAIEAYAGGVAVGGAFRSVGGVAARNVAWWDGTGWRALGAGRTGEVTGLAVVDGDLIVATRLPEYDDPIRSAVARWDGQEWRRLGDDLFDEATGLVNYQGSPVVCGRTPFRLSEASALVIRWDGAAWRAMDNTIGGEVARMIASGPRLVVGGRMYRVSPYVSLSAAEWSGTRWEALRSPIVQGISYAVGSALAFDGERLAASGSSSSTRFGIFRESMPGVWTVMDADRLTGVTALGTHGGRLFAAHRLNRGNSYAASPSMHVDSGASLGSWQRHTPAGSDGTVTSAVWSDQGLVVSGTFSRLGEATVRSPALWDGSAWRTMGDATVYPWFRPIPWRGTVVAAIPDSAGAAELGVWEHGQWTPIPESHAAVYGTVAVDGDDLLAVPQTSGAPDAPLVLARWNGEAWTRTEVRSGLVIRRLVPTDEGLYAMAFDHSGNFPITYLVRWTGAGWERAWDLPPRFGLASDAVNFRGRVVAMCISDPTSSDGNGRYVVLMARGGGGWQEIARTPVNAIAPSRLDADENFLVARGSGLVEIGGVRTSGVAVWDGVVWRAPIEGIRPGLGVTTVSSAGLSDVSWRGVSWAYAGTMTRGLGEPTQFLTQWTGDMRRLPGASVYSLSISAPPGSTIRIPITVSGEGCEVQWSFGTTPLSDGPFEPGRGIVTGSRTRLLTIENAGVGASGYYSASVRNACGTLTTSRVLVWVLRRSCPADLTSSWSWSGYPDRAVTIEDLLFFLDAYLRSNLAADLDDGSNGGNPDSNVSVEDLVYFLEHYASGC